MAVCDIQTLLTDGKCAADMPIHVLEAAEVQLLCDFLKWAETGEDILTCDIQTLLNENPCNLNLSAQQLAVLRLQLLCKIFEEMQDWWRSE